MELRSITVETLAAFAQALRAEERCTETIKQYTRSVRQFAAWLAPETVAAGSAGGWKAELLRRGLSPATVNSKLAGLNRFFRFLGWMDCTVKPLRLQRRLFRSPDRELSRAEYGRLLSAARGLGRERLGLLMEAICATGIRAVPQAAAIRAGTKNRLRRDLSHQKRQRHIQKAGVGGDESGVPEGRSGRQQGVSP